MRKIAVGLLFLLVRINLFGIEWLPEFLGVYLISKGINTLREDCPELGAMERFLKRAITLFAVIWVWNGASAWGGNLVNNCLWSQYFETQVVRPLQIWQYVSGLMSVVTWLLRLAGMVLTVMVLVRLSLGMYVLKAAGHGEVNCTRLHGVFTATAAVQIGYFLFQLLLRYAGSAHGVLSDLLLSLQYDLYKSGVDLFIWTTVFRQIVGLMLPVYFFWETRRYAVIGELETERINDDT